MTTHYGRVISVTFKNTASSFYILKMRLDGTDQVVTVKGTVAGLVVEEGAWFGFTAKHKHHPKFGEQYEILKAPVLEAWDASKAHKALVANGISGMYLNQLASRVPDFLAALSDVQVMVAHIPEAVAEMIAEKWKFCQAFYQTFDLLAQLGIPASTYSQVWSMFGDRTKDVLTEDPWQLVVIDGISFESIDLVADTLGISKNTPGRVKGILLYALRKHQDFGDAFVTLDTLMNRVHLLDDTMDSQRIAIALADLHKAKKLVVDRKTRPGVTAIYEPWNYKVEKLSAEMLTQRIASATWLTDDTSKDFYLTALEAAMPTPVPNLDLDTLIQTVVRQWSDASQITLSRSQEQGIFNALRHPISIITGLPGTGKTTSLRLLVRVLQAAQIRFLLVAPTGIAAKRMHNVTGNQASTIHRAFGCTGIAAGEERKAVYEGVVSESSLKTQRDDSGDDWDFGPDNPHPAQYVIVDESSMLDQALFYRLLACTSDKCRLVFVGDSAQLPSVGPGNVLADLIASQIVPVTALTEIFRQDHISDIVVAAHQIYNGQVPDMNTEDFQLLPEALESEVLRVILEKALEMEASGDSYQIISPRHGGFVGVTNLNTHLRELLNPKSDSKPEVPFDQSTIRLGDKVMVVKNNYTHSVFNGDQGWVVGINRAAGEISVDVDGIGSKPQRVVLKLDEAKQLLRLAYAATTHKCQGQEWDRIIMPVVPSFKHQLQRNLLYTAITRARKKVLLVGSTASVAQAVHNTRQDARNTLFAERIAACFVG